ncbi:hypothetical protein [Paenibacillus endoradicis]|uniref:hypothetical protein n=1 Tax=Paenibacillus endoradicis TaxID=2972487 RepID=UPI002158D57E|nr:hypothetical protein [Paenibacillus endoradicis]MCR8657560.1 hypothetical protein [Paenibacillus endoradicis]
MSKANIQFLSLWSINDELNLVKLKNQLDELKVCGLEGVVFHPRFYPGKPAYMSLEFLTIVSDLILYAQKIGMAFWIYDENGWPSGTASGKVLLENPQLVCQWLSFQENEGGGKVIQSGLRAEKPYSVVLKEKKAVSSLDVKATRIFITLTYEAYKQHLHPDAFAYVSGFFSDEVGFLDGHSISYLEGAVPWHPRVGELYTQKYGQELLDCVHLLFVDEEAASETRIRYWETVTEVLKEAYYDEINTWCERHDKWFTAHLKGEENPFFQLTYSGSMFQILPAVNAPAIDALERYPGNHFYPRALHSIAAQQGSPISLVEAMGGAGWGITPESFTRYVLWLAGHGLNTFVLHLNQLNLSMHACHDWPPSIPSHLSWKSAFADVLKDIRSKVAAMPDLRQQSPELLIVTPTRGITAHFNPKEANYFNEHDGSGILSTSTSSIINNQFMSLVEMVYKLGIHYEFTEEKQLEQAVVENGVVHIGQRCYSRILFPEGVELEIERNGDFRQTCLNAGIEIVTVDDIEARYIERSEEIRNAEFQDRFKSAKHLTPEQSQWWAEPAEENSYLLELELDTYRMELTSFFDVEGTLTENLKVRLLDPALEVILNGQRLNVAEDNAMEYVVPAIALLGHNELKVIPASWPSEPHTIAFIEGQSFLVCSKSDFVRSEQDERQSLTKGPFYLVAGNIFAPEQVVESGFPFHSGKVTISKTLHISELREKVRFVFGQLQADAALVRLDGREIGWIWGPQWELEVHHLDEGEHLLQLDLIPSTYNTYGPHRHYEGDRHLISPAQYEGVKNFADHPEAPDNTLIEQWHFVRCGIIEVVQVQVL